MISDELILEQLNNDCKIITIYLDKKNTRIVYNKTKDIYECITDRYAFEINDTTINRQRIQYSHDPTIKVHYNVHTAFPRLISFGIYKEYNAELFNVIDTLYNNRFTHPTINYWMECQKTVLK